MKKLRHCHPMYLLCFCTYFPALRNYCLLWPHCVADAGIIFCPVVSSSSFFLSSSSSFSSPNLSRRRLDVCHTSTHGVAVVRIYDAGLKRAARGSLKIQNAKNRQNSPSGHHRTTLSGYISAIKAHIDNRKKLLNSNTSSTCPHNMAKCGPLTAEIGSRVCGTPANFNGFHVLAALLHDTLVVSVSQTLRR